MVASAIIFLYLPIFGIDFRISSKKAPSHLSTEMGGSFYYIQKTIRQIRKATFSPRLNSNV